MIYSNKRKLCLSGWLKQHCAMEYESPLKLQKFLFLYESFAKVSGEKPDFDHLRGYKRGPVFSNVWGDYTKERLAFDRAAEECYENGKDQIKEDRAQRSSFIVRTLSEKELSELTHKMNLWKAKEKRILSGEYQVELDEKDFDHSDKKLIKMLEKMYPMEMVSDSTVYSLNNYNFVFRKEAAERLTATHMDALFALSESEELHNPVFVELDEEGRLIID